MKKTSILRFLFLLLFSALLYGQTTPYSFSVNKISGMPSDMVYDVMQDRQGFMWFATAKGICRFDGLQVKNYASVDLSIKGVSNLHQDSKGRIWFQDFNGNIFFIKNDKIETFTLYKANGFLKFGFIKNQLFIVGKDGIKIFNVDDFKLIKHLPFDLKTTKQSLATKDRFYLIGEEVHFVTSDFKIQKVDLPRNYKADILAPIASAQGNDVYIISKFNENYLKINSSTVSKHRFPFKSIFTQNASVINNEIWLCSTKGMYRYSPATNQYQYYFPNKNISFVTKTTSGNYWVSTITDGALYVDDFQSDFIETASVPIRLAKKGDAVLFSTNREEIFKIDADKTISTVYRGPSEHMITPLLVDDLNDRLLFTSSKFIIKSPKSKLENILAVKNIVQLDAKYYAVSASTWNGIVYVDPHLKSKWDSELEKFPKSTQNGIHFIPLITSENGKDCIFDEKNRAIYFLTNYGIKRYHDGKVNEVSTDHSLAFTQLSLLNGNLLILSENEKLYQAKSGKYELLRFPNQFENSSIKKIKYNGKSIFIFKESAIYNYFPEAFRIEKAINIPKDVEVHDLLEDGKRLYFSTSKGIIQISGESSNKSPSVQLFVNSITVNGQPFSENQLKNLSSFENNIEINLDVLSETPNVLYGVQYKIDDTPWEKLPNTNRNLRFSSLSGGLHVVIIKISNGNQVLEKQIQFTISSPFYLKWWFVILAVLLTSGITYLIFRRNLEKLKLKNQRELEKVNLEKLANQHKLQSLKSQMNPHFFFNALNTLQSYIVSNEKKEAVFYLSKFSKLTRSFLDMSDRETISLQEEIRILETYLDLEKARFDSDFNYEISVVGECKNLSEGVKSIRKENPDLIFLDIEMPGHSGLELLDFFNDSEINFSIIFVTAYNQYAINAFKLSAVDYLLKPINPKELQEAVALFRKQKSKTNQLLALKNNLEKPEQKRMALSVSGKILFVDFNEILYLKGDGAYTHVIKTDKTSILISKNLKYFEEIFEDTNHLMRVHRSYIANLSHVKSAGKTDGCYIEFSNRDQIPVSYENFNKILEKMNYLKR